MRSTLLYPRKLDILSHNRLAWDRQVEQGNRWTVPVTHEQIIAARKGEWDILLTPTRAVPRGWFPSDLHGCSVLCLASGGGQQAPVLAAAGAVVTVLDNSPRQLQQDRLVAEREGLNVTTLEGDMADLSRFADGTFELIFHPVSNIFAPEILPVWREAFRVLKPGGILLAGIANPVFYIFDPDQLDAGKFKVKYSLPYSDLVSLSPARRKKYLDLGYPLEFSHTLDEQIGGQMAAGFMLVGFYEDYDPESALQQIMPTFFATRALKP